MKDSYIINNFMKFEGIYAIPDLPNVNEKIIVLFAEGEPCQDVDSSTDSCH